MTGRVGKPHGRARQRWRRRLSIAGVVIALGAVTLWLLFQHKPTWYEPVDLDRRSLVETQNDATYTADLVSDQMVRGRPFEVTLSDTQVTRWLTALPEMVPESQVTWPASLAAPGVRFEPGRVRAGVVCEGSGWRSLMSLSLRVEADPDAGVLRVAVESTGVGSLPVPRLVVVNALKTPLERLFRRAEARELMPKFESVDQIYEGVPIRNRFVWPNGKRAFRIGQIRFEDRTVRILIEPI